MRFVILILSLLFALNLHAKENWTWVKFNDTDAAASAPMGAEDADLVPNPDEPKVVGFFIYFLHRNGCIPVINLPSKQRVTGLQLRVDEREVYRPSTIKWIESPQKSSPGVLSAVFPPANLSEEQKLEYVQMTESFLVDVSEGNILSVKLEPSGEVRRWSLRGSKKAIDAALEYCSAGIVDHTYFSK